jgi:hypothetical protein
MLVLPLAGIKCMNVPCFEYYDVSSKFIKTHLYIETNKVKGPWVMYF